MPKVKTHRGAAKRFSYTGTGKIKKNKANRRHLLTEKASGRKMNLRKANYADKTNVAAIKKLIPYG